MSRCNSRLAVSLGFSPVRPIQLPAVMEMFALASSMLLAIAGYWELGTEFFILILNLNSHPCLVATIMDNMIFFSLVKDVIVPL